MVRNNHADGVHRSLLVCAQSPAGCLCASSQELPRVHRCLPGVGVLWFYQPVPHGVRKRFRPHHTPSAMQRDTAAIRIGCYHRLSHHLHGELHPMRQLAINIVRYNQEFPLLEDSIQAALNQDLDNFEVVLTENGSSDSIKGRLLQRFGADHRFRYEENTTNLGFAGGHNRFIHTVDAEFVLPLNPDTQLTPEYARTVLAVFSDPLVAAAEGKMLKPVPLPDGRYILDGTGMSLSRARRAGERGQLQIDEGQFDHSTNVFGVSATAAIYRTSALERVKHGDTEYFDEDLFTYWEDLDLAW